MWQMPELCKRDELVHQETKSILAQKELAKQKISQLQEGESKEGVREIRTKQIACPFKEYCKKVIFIF